MKDRPKKIELRLGTRASLLAQQQAHMVKKRVEELNPEITVTLVHIKTTGDKLDFPLLKVGGKGLFVKEIEEALTRKEIDLAVHSAKDLPAIIPEGLILMAFPEREDPRDALVSQGGKRFEEVPQGGKIGTGSLRRKAQLLNLRPDLEIVPLRGNLDTRLKKLMAMNLDGVILAAAGLRRMNWEGQVSEFFDPETMVPAIGQGALAVEAREGDERVRRAVASLDHPPTRVSVLAERAFLRRLEGGCQVPIGGLARIHVEKLALTGLVAGVDGRRVVKGKVEGPLEKNTELGVQLAEDLLGRGAEEILREVYQKG
ncbi:MAG TPA: hydroxymethylbilane synthase [Thermodesulfobacteriota bacterium]|nr:hydroxymethylbilane synthase [Thermodesulfobacteriota bacterium]